MSEDTPASSPALDHLGPGVSAKIREAIKAKLVELSVYVDDELPDYIMVMVANRKSPDQMKQDLGLFLNEHNQVFVDWLDHVLQKLQKVAQEGRGKKKVTKKKVKKEDDPPRKTKTKKTPVRSELKHEEYDPVTEETHRRKREKSARSRSRSPLFSDKDRDRHSDRDRDRHSDRDRDRHSVRDRDRHLDRDPDRHSNRDPDRYSRSSRRSDSRPSHTRDRDHRPVAPRQLGSRQSPGRHFSARRRSPDPSNNSSPPRRGPSSVIGAVISHDSDGEYDPEQILKRALVASKVQVARPPPPKVSANKNLVLKAVADADRSLKRRRIDERDRDLKAVHEKRALLSQARRAGNLDDQTLKAITRDRSPSPMKPEQSPRISRKPVTSPVRRSRSSKISRESRLSRKRDTTLPRIKGMRADEEEEKQQVKTKKPPIPSQSSPPQRSTQLGDLDLRYHLGQRKLGTSLNTLARQSGLTIKVRNDLVQTTSQDPKLSEQDEDDPNIETMRQKALESMRKGTLRRSASQDEKKIIIPLNEESSEDDTDCDESAADKETVDGSSSSSDSVPPKLDPSKRPPASAKDPQFIVTLQGIDKKYFKKAKNQSAIPPPPLIVSKSVDQSKTTVALSKKPEAKVAPSVRSETKPLRKRITAPEPDPVALPSLPLTSVPAIAFAPKTAVDRPICKYWPRCSRGDSCFFFHPKSNPSTNFASSIHQKPTISRIPSKEKLTWTAASAKPI